jgi:hypothetical protein
VDDGLCAGACARMFVRLGATALRLCYAACVWGSTRVIVGGGDRAVPIIRCVEASAALRIVVGLYYIAAAAAA